MAKRFGGPHSPSSRPESFSETTAGGTSRLQEQHIIAGPTGKNARRVRQRPPVGAASNVLFVLPFLWAFSAFFQPPSELVQHLGTFALLMLSAWLTRDGIIAHAAYDERKIARRPAIPRKLFGSVAMGLGLALASIPGLGVIPGTVLGVLGGVLHLTSFGLDPMRNKVLEGIDEFQTDRVAQAVQTAEGHLAAMARALDTLGDRRLDARIGEFADHVRPLLRAVENDPQQLGAARRYLGVYLEGARDATVKFTDLYSRIRDEDARREYLALLDDLERNFEARVDSFRTSDRQRLDIEVEVLRERLAREGVRTDADAAALPAPSETDRPLIDPLDQAASLARKS